MLTPRMTDWGIPSPGPSHRLSIRGEPSPAPSPQSDGTRKAATAIAQFDRCIVLGFCSWRGGGCATPSNNGSVSAGTVRAISCAIPSIAVLRMSSTGLPPRQPARGTSSPTSPPRLPAQGTSPPTLSAEVSVHGQCAGQIVHPGGGGGGCHMYKTNKDVRELLLIGMV